MKFGMKMFKNIFIAILLVTSIVLVACEDSEESTTAGETTDEATSEVETSSVGLDSATTEDQSATSEVKEESTKAPKSKSSTVNPYTKSSKTPQKGAESEDTCSPWPSTIKPLRECCFLPHNPLAVTLNSCLYRCMSRETNEKYQIECGALCFVNSTGFILNGHFNRERVKNLLIGPSVVPAKWIRVIENAVDSCKFDSHATIHDSLARFFACVNDFMVENCVNFVQTPECEKTQDLYEYCHHIKPPCEHWPFGYALLENCCKIPPLFSQKLRTKCHHECTYSELFLQRQAKCDEICRYDDTKLRVNNKFNFDVIKAMLDQSADGNSEWIKPINQAVEKCKSSLGSSTINYRKNTIDYEITALQTCLREHLANNCVEFKEERACKKLKMFMNNCPHVRPRISTSQAHYGSHLRS